MNRFLGSRNPAVASATSCFRRRVKNETIHDNREFKLFQSLFHRSGSQRPLTVGCYQYRRDSDSQASRKTMTRVRNYHHKGPDPYHDSVADEDPSATLENPGCKAFVLEKDRHALVDLFRKHASSEGTLDKKALGLVLKAVGETPDEETLEQIFHEADLDGNGAIDLEEFLTGSDKILGSAPAGMVLVVGGPGSGKGVLSKRLVEECGVVHISSGDLLREEVERDTPLGREVKEIMISGDLVSSAVIVTLMRRKMRLPENAGKRVLLDGFPRSTQNAKDLVELCGEPELALHLQCDDTILVERILNRKEKASSSGEGRDDDNIRTALQRLRNYHNYLHVTIDWLRQNHVPVVNLDCDCPPDQVWEQLLAIGRLVRPATTIDKEDLSMRGSNKRDSDEKSLPF